MTMNKQFVISSVFEKIKTMKIKGKANDFPTQSTNDYRIPLLTAGIENQGLARYAREKDCPTILQNVISVSANGANSGAVFYQPEKFAVLQDAYAIKVRNYDIRSSQIGLYLATCLHKAIADNHDWNYKAGWNRIKNDILTLPIKCNEGLPVIDNTHFYHKKGYIPDWDYMHECIQKIESERIDKLDKYLIDTGLNDYVLTEEDKHILTLKLNEGEVSTKPEDYCKYIRKFRIGDLFDVVTPTKRFNANSISITDNKGHPYVVRSSLNNGIRGYINEDEQYLNPANTFSFGQDTATVFWQTVPYFTGDKIKVLVPKFKCNDKIAMYQQNGISKAFSHFSWGTQSFKLSVIENSEYFLPIQTDSNNNPIIDNECKYHPKGYIPDWNFMEKYIRAIEKVVVKNVVDWGKSQANS